MNQYEMTLPDGQRKTFNSKSDFAFAIAYLETDSTSWDFISKHLTFEAATKRKNTLWTRNIKGGRNARKNWITAIQIVEVQKVGN